MDQRGKHTIEEIMSQPEAWQAALEVLRAHTSQLKDLLHNGNFDSVVFIGCGSTYYLSLAAAALLQEQTSINARGLPASEVWLYPRSAYQIGKRTLLVAVSRSGETTETLRAVEAFRSRANGAVLTISCYPECSLATMGDVNIVLPSGSEQSIAQTRAFSVMYLAAVYLVGLWANQAALIAELDQLPTIGRKVIETHGAAARAWGKRLDLERFYFLGSGPRYGLAAELSLKMKEMTLSHSEPFHFPEFRHGPQSMVTDTTLMVGLVSQVNEAFETAVLDDMRKRGAHILSIGEAGGEVAFQSGLSEIARNILCLPMGQLMAFERALQKGLDPDHPHNLDAVVRLSL